MRKNQFDETLGYICLFFAVPGLISFLISLMPALKYYQNLQSSLSAHFAFATIFVVLSYGFVNLLPRKLRVTISHAFLWAFINYSATIFIFVCAAVYFVE